MNLSRRDVLCLSAFTAAAWKRPLFAGTHRSTAGSMEFPDRFVWGSATASYQVEGAVNEDGRGKTIWDTFSHTPGKTHNGDTGDVSTDSYHRFPEDIALMKDLGLTGCRFSIAWSRIFPEGRGAPNQKGIDHYHRLVDALLTAGVQPYCTLYHWDLPQALEDRGGWRSRDTAEAFAEYAAFVAKHFSDKIRSFMTMNEVQSFIYSGYSEGRSAPGLKLSRKEVAQSCHYAVLAHGLGVQAIRTQAKPGTEVGFAENPRTATPLLDTVENITAARKAMVEENADIMNAIQTGRYTDLYLKTLGADAPKFTDAEMRAIGSSLDFTGLNCYVPMYVRADTSPRGYAIVPFDKSHPHAPSVWLKFGPEAIYWGPKLATDVWKLRKIYITENGCSADDIIAADGQVYDTSRITYLRNYLAQLHRGIEEGVPVKGYFLWSLLDNFEWTTRYSQRFGITYVDYATQKRTPKQSFYLYKAISLATGCRQRRVHSSAAPPAT